MSAVCGYGPAEGLDSDALLERHLPLVKRIANHLRGRLPDNVDIDDMMQSGLIALLDAARHYSPEKGASFETYAAIRVRGAMLDEVRRNNWAPRSVHRRQRELSTAVHAVENREGRAATARELADEMGMTLDEYHKTLTSVSGNKLFSLEQLSGDQPGGGDWPAGDEAGPAELFENQAFREVVVAAIADLPEREALVMSLYYDEELNLREIGEVLGVTESRVCQIHAQALVRLRARVQAWQNGATDGVTRP